MAACGRWYQIIHGVLARKVLQRSSSIILESQESLWTIWLSPSLSSLKAILCHSLLSPKKEDLIEKVEFTYYWNNPKLPHFLYLLEEKRVSRLFFSHRVCLAYLQCLKRKTWRQGNRLQIGSRKQQQSRSSKDQRDLYSGSEFNM